MLIQKLFERGEDTDPKEPTSSMEVFIVLLPDSQFLCSSHSDNEGASAVDKYGESASPVLATLV